MIRDSGPIYRETDITQFPVEPWATVSQLIFFVLIIYWSVKIFKNLKLNKFIAFAIPLLFIQSTGATVYHAFRYSSFWLYLDFIPLLIFCIAVLLHFFLRLKAKHVFLFPLTLMPFILIALLANIIKDYKLYFSLIVYISFMTPIVLTLIPFMIKSKWKHWPLAGLSLLSLILAILFRTIDKLVNLSIYPMGTHWLWHVFGAVCIHFLFLFIFRLNQPEEGQN